MYVSIILILFPRYLYGDLSLETERSSYYFLSISLIVIFFSTFYRVAIDS